MNIIRNSAATVALVLSLGLAFPAAAQGTYGAVDSATRGTVQVGDSPASDAKTSGSAQVGLDVNVGAGASGSAKSDDSSNASESSDVRVQGGDVNGDGKADITGDPDFDLSAMQMESTEDHVALTSKQHAKLFGFIPITVNATAVVDANGHVKVKFPWFAFLAVTNKTDLEAKLQTAVNASGVVTAREAGSGMATGRVAKGDVTGDGTAGASVKLSANAQTRLVAALRAALQSEFNAEGNARVNKVDSFTVKQ